MSKIIKNNWAVTLTGVLLVLGGIALDIVIQTGGTLALIGTAKVLHVGKNTALPIVAMILVFAILLGVTVKILLSMVRVQAPKTGVHAMEGHKLAWVFKGYGLILASSMVMAIVQSIVLGKPETAANQASLQELAHSGLAPQIFLVLLAAVLAPLVEELIFRGVLMNYFFKNASWWWANVLFSGLVFGYFHVVMQQFQWFALIQYSLMGVVLAIVYKKTRQIQYSMLTHCLNNSVAMLIMLISIAK
ncbi:MAG: CPBP family intramembrane metalloprotease [Lactobacillaceae bacterium]|jgi:membrane protease YdiL (CAAX protease family)|nr:CPBP family intramembrane metalloprotease [Lactobacillaceae bacterium]